MLQLPPQMRILVAVESVDGRKGIDGLAQVCRQKLAEDPFSGCVFIFKNRRGTSLKILAYDGQGFFTPRNASPKTLSEIGRPPIPCPPTRSIPTRRTCSWRPATRP